MFNEPQAFNGHKSNCRIHLGEEKYQEAVERRLNASKKGRQVLKEKNEEFHAQKDLELRRWIDEQHKCERCGKVMTERYGSGRFCSKSCANAREHSIESREKTSKTMKQRVTFTGTNTSNLDFSIYVDEAKELYVSGVVNRKNLQYYTKDKVEFVDFVRCPYCNCRMSQLQTRHLQLHSKTKQDLQNDFGESYQTVSEASHIRKSQSSSETQHRLVEEGKHKGWQSRNIRSYAELFWEKVLDNNKIQYDPEHTVNKKCLGVYDGSNYFLDFFIDGFIDLEIDGKQHKYEDRQESDKIRDRLLKQHGFVVYRIPWIDPKQKEKVKAQIDEFLTWYNGIKDEEGIIVY
jgi:hypothetical protein